MKRKRKNAPIKPVPSKPSVPAASSLRIIGGRLRGRKVLYSGDPRTRPMKERVREAAMNLIGPAVEGKIVFDLFAGTGALALESLSRGAERATLIERHFPSARLIERNAATLGLAEAVEVVRGDTFLWARRLPPADPARPWLVFCSPPYAFYSERLEEMLRLIGDFYRAAPAGSLLMVESDETLDPTLLPEAASWDVRVYPPAVLAVLYKEPADG